MPLVYQKEISKAVTDILKKNFRGHKVYSDEAQEGFTQPAFFIELLLKSDNETLNFNSNQLTIIITYLPKTHTAIDNMNMQDKLKELFGLLIDIGSRKLKIKSISFSNTGEKKEILQANIIIEYFDKTNVMKEEFEIAKDLQYVTKG